MRRAPDASAHPDTSDVRRDLFTHLHRPFGLSSPCGVACPLQAWLVGNLGSEMAPHTSLTPARKAHAAQMGSHE